MLSLERINRIINDLLTWRKKRGITYKISSKIKMNIKMEEIWNIIWNYFLELYKSENKGEMDNFLAKYKLPKWTLLILEIKNIPISLEGKEDIINKLAYIKA